jgi:hypothetical protein
MSGRPRTGLKPLVSQFQVGIPPLRRPEIVIMALTFPNPCRSYDPARSVVRFWGYENAMEKSFLVDEEMLRRLQPGVRREEAALLDAFDMNQDLIHAAAKKAYGRGGKGFYLLTATDFGVARTQSAPWQTG